MTLTTQSIQYRDGATCLTGYLVFDAARPGLRPGILLVHGGAGLDDHAKQQAVRYAELGYIVLACDMFGEEVMGDRTRMIDTMIALRDDPDAMLRRGLAGLATLTRSPRFNGQAAAIGFCFGGLAVLEFARAGMDVAGAVSIHGSLATTQRCSWGSVKAKVLVCHGGRDPHVPLVQVVTFIDEMNAAGADCQLVIYGRAMHGFTHQGSPVSDGNGVAFDRTADSRSFAAVHTFLRDVLTVR